MLKKAHSGKYVRMGFVLYGESKILWKNNFISWFLEMKQGYLAEVFSFLGKVYRVILTNQCRKEYTVIGESLLCPKEVLKMPFKESEYAWTATLVEPKKNSKAPPPTYRLFLFAA